MRRATGLASVGLIVACGLTGCGDSIEGNCNAPQQLDYFQTGSYSAPGGKPTDLYCSEGCSATFTPHDGATELVMDLDVEANTAVIRYTRDGKAVEERWRIATRKSN